MGLRGMRGQARPPGHSNRPIRSELEFAEEFFGTSSVETAAACHVFRALGRLTSYNVSGLEPDDCIGDLIDPPDSLDRVEAAMAIDLHSDLTKRHIAEEVFSQQYWGSVLSDLLGSAAAACSWNPSTLPSRSVRGVVAEIAKLSNRR